jgi:hypothetical protein
MDNCSGQNKNQFLMAFMAYLVKCKHFKSIKIKFMVPGHTHFSPDRVFAWTNKLLKLKDLYTPEEVLLSVNENTNKIKASMHDKFQDWKSFLEKHHGAVKGISKFAEVCFVESHPDKLFHSDKFSESSLAPNLKHYNHQKFWKNGIPDISQISTKTKDESTCVKKKKSYLNCGILELFLLKPRSFTLKIEVMCWSNLIGLL